MRRSADIWTVRFRSGCPDPSRWTSGARPIHFCLKASAFIEIGLLNGPAAPDHVDDFAFGHQLALSLDASNDPIGRCNCCSSSNHFPTSVGVKMKSILPVSTPFQACAMPPHSTSSRKRSLPPKSTVGHEAEVAQLRQRCQFELVGPPPF